MSKVRIAVSATILGATIAMAASANAGASGSVICGLKDGGCYFRQDEISVYVSRRTDPASVQGEIRNLYERTGWENGFLGYPMISETCGLVRDGCWNDFQGGATYFSPAAGTHFVRGLIREKWGSRNWEHGTFGYPATDEFCGLRASGCGQHFELENGSIYWSPTTGAHTVQGLIKNRWAELGWEAGALGYPTSDEDPQPYGGVVQTFEGGWLAWTGGEVYGEPWPDNPALAGTRVAAPQAATPGNIQALRDAANKLRKK